MKAQQPAIDTAHYAQVKNMYTRHQLDSMLTLKSNGAYTVYSKVLSGTLLQTAYPISYPVTQATAPSMVLMQAYSSNAAVNAYVSAPTTTGFTANFATVPIVGTNNITVYYILFK